MNNENPIGIFDSGIGGLSIARRIREILPNENILYIADSAHAPYGDKTEPYITDRSDLIFQFLIERNVKAIVIACNTATVLSIHKLRSKYAIPIIGVEPGVKPAINKTNNGIIGVLATTQTLKSMSFNDLAKEYSESIRIEVQPCPGLVEQVENLDHKSCKTEALVKEYTLPLLKKGVDCIVLGCTHYAFIEPIIKRVTGSNIEIVNTDFAVAQETARRLESESLLSKKTTLGCDEFWSSGNQYIARNQFDLLWERNTVVRWFKK